MTAWYTADPHFNHDNIIHYCKRPFASVYQMDDVLVENYTACVKPEDDLWIVGDFGFEYSSRKGYLDNIFARLPGHKHLVIGNHDSKLITGFSWDSAHDIVTVKDGDQNFVLCHYPMLTWEGARKGAIQLFGHVHNYWRGTRNSVNVGVDLWNFKPVQKQDIITSARLLPDNLYWSVVEPGVALKTG